MPADPADRATPLMEQPLAPRSGPRGATLFAELPSQRTGIISENRYEDPAMWAQRYAAFATGAVGTGVAIGDYDDDGRADLFVVSKTESCRLFRNLGDWRFADVTEQAGVADVGSAALIWKQGATFVDVNNDARLDIYVCRFTAANLLYINQGDGTFHEEAASRGLAVADGSVMAAFHDFDRDGWLDVFVQTNWPEAFTERHEQRNYLFRNYGNGTFSDVTGRAGISGRAQGHSAIWWDYDGDAWPDLYVANDFNPPDQLLRNNRDGTFTNVIDAVVPHMPFSSMGADLGDVNNDGLIDLLVADMAATTHEKDQRTMANARRLIVDPPDHGAAFAMRNALFLNTGAGRMLEAACLAGIDATDWTWSVRFEDLDNDGLLDLHVTNGMYREPHNTDLMTRIAAAETVTEKIRIERASRTLEERNLAFRNCGDLAFANVSSAWGLDQSGVSFGAAFGDLDGDGDLDLVFSNYKRGVTVLRNDADSGHRVVVALRGTQSNPFGVGATVQIETDSGAQIRSLVLARGVLSSSEPVLHFGTGEDLRIQRLTVVWPSGRTQTFTNLAVDHRYVVTEAAEANDAPPQMRSTGSPQFTDVSKEANLAWKVRAMAPADNARPRLMPLRPNRRGPALAVGDLNGDGIDDIVCGSGCGEAPRVLVVDSQGRYTVASSSAFEPDEHLGDGPLLVFDADGDGANDLLQTRGGDGRPAGAPEYQPRLLLNDGRGQLRAAPAGMLPAFPESTGAVAAADIDRSGRLSLFLGGRLVPGDYPSPPRSALWANRGDRFEDITDQVAPGLRSAGMVTAAIWSDVTGDGWPDLVLTLEWGGVRCWRNLAGQRFEDWTEAGGFATAGNGWWSSLTAADFNRDGRPDFVAGNLGLNTTYRAEATRPLLLFQGDFAGDGVPVLLEARHEGERVFPRRTRHDLGAAIPAILRRFPRNDPFARATLTEIFDDAPLAAARKWAVTELSNGVFLSTREGTYRFAALPRLAQIAPLHGVVAADFDGDGNADVIGAQNSDAPIASVGRFDGGLGVWLRGDGQGGFLPVPTQESGLLVTGSATALVHLDLNRDGWADFVTSRYGDSTLAYRNERTPGRRMLAIRLRGPLGNPTGVGAKVNVELLDGTKFSSEVYAAGGCFSQSSAAVFVGSPDANPPRVVHVEWPTGVKTEHAIPGGASTLVVAAPGVVGD